MYPTYQYQPPALRIYEPQGLGFKLFGKNITLGGVVKGLLGQAVKTVAAFVAQIPIVGPEAANQLIMAWDKNWGGKVQETIDRWIPMGKTAASAAITPEEEAIIKFWYTYKFEPWLTALLAELKAASAINDLTAKLAAINVVINKAETVQMHYELYETDGLTSIGIEQRGALIEYTLGAAWKTATDLAKELGGEEYYTTFKPSIYNFAPLFTGTPIVSVQDVSNFKVPGTTVTTPVITPGKVITSIKPGSVLDASPIKLTPGTLTPIKTATGSTTTGTTTGNTVTTTSPPKVSAPVTAEADETPAEKKKNNTGVYVALGIGTAIAIYAATRKKKAKK